MYKHHFQASGNQDIQSTFREAKIIKLRKPVHLIPKLTYIYIYIYDVKKKQYSESNFFQIRNSLRYNFSSVLLCKSLTREKR